MRTSVWYGTEPSISLRLRWRLASFLVPRRTVQARGVRFTLQCDNPVTHFRWDLFNTKEPETLDWIDSWGGEAGTFLDVGANIGVYSLYAALQYPTLHVVALEPEYANLHLLRDNVIANGLQDRIEIVSIALGERPGLSYLHVQDLAPGAACHTVSREKLSVTLEKFPVVHREGVYELSLDDFCAKKDMRPGCIKIDVDGTEPEILSGAAETLARPDLRTLLIEFPADSASGVVCEKVLREAGFVRSWRDSTGRSRNQVWDRAGGS